MRINPNGNLQSYTVAVPRRNDSPIKTPVDSPPINPMDIIYIDPARAKVSFFDDLASAIDNSETHPDLVITCLPDASIKVHKFIVFKQAEWFKTANTSGFKEGQSDTINLQDDEGEVRAMIRYCYTCDYPTPEFQRASDALSFHIRMFAMAEFYQVRGLATVAAEKFEAAFIWFSDFENSRELAAAINHAYTTTTDQKKILRNAIVGVVIDQKKFLLTGNDAEFAKLMAEVPEFAIDVLNAMAKGSPERRGSSAPVAAAPTSQSSRSEIAATADRMREMSLRNPNSDQARSTLAQWNNPANFAPDNASTRIEAGHPVLFRPGSHDLRAARDAHDGYTACSRPRQFLPLRNAAPTTVPPARVPNSVPPHVQAAKRAKEKQ